MDYEIFNSTVDFEDYVNTLQTKDEIDLFALSYGPIIVNSKNRGYMTNILRGKTIYILPFIYGRAYLDLLQNKYVKKARPLIRDIIIELDRLPKIYQDGWHQDEIRPLCEKLHNYFANELPKLKTLGADASESTMIGYAPIVPYGEQVKKADEETGTAPMERALNPQVSSTGTYLELKDTIIDIVCKNITKVILMQPAMYAQEDYRNIWLQAQEAKPGEEDIYRYFYYIRYLNDPNRDVVTESLDMVIESITKPESMTQEEFDSVCEALMHATDEELAELIDSPAAEAIDEVSQEIITDLLAKTPREDTVGFDLDRLTSTIYNMRHIEISEYANRFFLGECSKIKISNYNYIGEMLVCEINDKYLAVPYIDIADDYKIKIITMNRDGEIEILDDMDALGATVKG